MRNRSDLYSLMAKKEEAAKAAVLSEVRNLQAAHSRASELTEKLRDIVNERQVSGPGTAAELRSNAHLNTKLAAEAANQSARATELASALDATRQSLAAQSHKARFLNDAAQQARRAEEEEREKRMEASRITPRR